MAAVNKRVDCNVLTREKQLKLSMHLRYLLVCIFQLLQMLFVILIMVLLQLVMKIHNAGMIQIWMQCIESQINGKHGK